MAYNKKYNDRQQGEKPVVTKPEEKVEEKNEIKNEKTADQGVNSELFYKMLEQNQMLIQMLAERGVSVAPVVNDKNSLNEEVVLVHLKENAPGLTTHIELSNLTIDMSAFGEERTLDRRQAEELAGKYRKFFDRGVIAFGSGSEHLASKFGLKSVNDYSYVNKDFVKKLGTLSLVEL